jgi:hypothetical protein
MAATIGFPARTLGRSHTGNDALESTLWGFERSVDLVDSHSADRWVAPNEYRFDVGKLKRDFELGDEMLWIQKVLVVVSVPHPCVCKSGPRV